MYIRNHYELLGFLYFAQATYWFDAICQILFLDEGFLSQPSLSLKDQPKIAFYTRKV